MVYTIGLGIYLLVMISIGFLVKDRIKTAEDYLVAGRSFGLVFNSATLASCYIGGFAFVAIPGAAYSLGIWNTEFSYGVIALLGGAALCSFLAAVFFNGRMWRLKLLSLGDLFYNRYGRPTGIVATLLISFSFIFWISVQILVFSKIVNPILGWSVETAIVVAVIVICVYTMLGGLWAVTVTDLVQVSLILLAVAILFPFALDKVGGWSGFSADAPTELMHFLPTVNSGHAWLAWIAAWLIIGFGSIPSPDLMQRAFSAKSAKTARNSGLVATVVLLAVGTLTVVLAWMGKILMGRGTISESLLNGDPELILPVMIKEILPVPLVVLFLGAGLAAVMSAADSAMLALSGMITKNIYKDLLRPKADQRQMVLVSRLLVLATGITAGFVAISYQNAALLVTFGFDLILAGLFAPMVLGLYWPKANGWGALAGMFSGFAFRIIGAGIVAGFNFEGISTGSENWYIFTLLAPTINIIVMVVVSLRTQKQCEPIPLVFYDDVEPDPLEDESALQEA